MQLRYFVPFKAEEGVSADLALREKLINIEGVAIDSSVNANKWQVPPEDLDYIDQTLNGAQLRVDHAESALMVVGKVSEAKRDGDRVLFRAEVGDGPLIEKILRQYITHVSIQVDSENVDCSKCMRPTRKEGILVHLCPGAWEIVHRPKVRELSIVASPAYKDTEFKPVGFAAAMNASQHDAVLNSVFGSELPSGNDVGSKLERLQEPENKKKDVQEQNGVKHLSANENAEKGASPHSAQGVVNVAPGENAPKDLSYQDMMNQLEQLNKQITATPGASDAELDTLKKKVADLEGELGKRATKRQLSKKISELSKKLAEPDAGGGSEGDGQPCSSEASHTTSAAENAAGTPGTPSGKGIVAADEIQKDALGNYDWYKDLLKAHKRLTGFQ